MEPESSLLCSQEPIPGPCSESDELKDCSVIQGLCDNLLMCVVQAWDVKKPLLFCPAMNTCMWEHPVTATHIATPKNWGYTEVPSIAKTLVCGDMGLGAMAEVANIVDKIYKTLGIYSC
jgi:phosphopantothenoylcysteine decarboxylase